MSSSTNNKHIVKNTLMLYARTIITMVVSLYASRVILEQLGISDYGVYNVVGGIVTMLTMLSATLSGATQRYITFTIGKNNPGELKKVFTASVVIHSLLVLLVLICAETVGLWFLNEKINIPEGRLTAANIIFQFSVFSFMMNILSLPYESAIIAYEKFHAYAFIYIAQSLTRLTAVSCLSLCSWDKLIIYAMFELTVQLITRGSFVIYVKRKIKDCKLARIYDKELYREILGFTSWNFLGTSSSIAYTQGGNIVLNIFWGVALNAAKGVTAQIEAAVTNFVSNFTVAVNPQITKSYSTGDYVRTNELIMLGSKVASYLILVIAYPIVVNIDYILHLWLIETPDYTIDFVRLSLLVAFANAFNNPFNCAIFATGNIKCYQIVCVTINVSSLALLYEAFVLEASPNVIYYILLMQSIIKLSFMIGITKKATGFSIRSFLTDVYLRNILFATLIIATIFIKTQYHYDMGFISFVAESLVYVTVICGIIILFGLKGMERRSVLMAVRKRVSHKRM